jgi:hypothetical protein
MTSLSSIRARQLPVVVVIACLAAGAVWFGSRSDAGPPASDPTGLSDPASSQHIAPDTAPRGGVVLPDGTAHVDGNPVGFPYTDLGAVAAHAAASHAQVGFDYAQAADIAAIYAAPEDQASSPSGPVRRWRCAANRSAPRRTARCLRLPRRPSPRSPTPSRKSTPTTTR